MLNKAFSWNRIIRIDTLLVSTVTRQETQFLEAHSILRNVSTEDEPLYYTDLIILRFTSIGLLPTKFRHTNGMQFKNHNVFYYVTYAAVTLKY